MEKINETKELEKQRLGRNKNTIVNHAYINSGEYKRKIDSIANNVELSRIIYKLAKDMLTHRSGTLFEDMYWIDGDTFEIMAQEIDSVIEEKIIYSEKTSNVVNEYKESQNKSLITIHTHPNSFPPSIDDFNSNCINCYSIGIVVCHNGKVYIYSAEEEISPEYYNLVVAEYLNNGYNEEEAQIKALEEISQNFRIKLKEVTDDDTRK